jgi:hypothetical protein
VIAAGSVVRGTVPDRCVAAGVPARVVRRYQPGEGWSPAPRPVGPGPAATERAGLGPAGLGPAGLGPAAPVLGAAELVEGFA